MHAKMANARVLRVLSMNLYGVKLSSTPHKASLVCPDFDTVEASLMILRQMSESNIFIYENIVHIAKTFEIRVLCDETPHRTL